MFGSKVANAMKLASIEADLVTAAAESPAHLHAEVFAKFAALIEDEDDFEAITDAVIEEVELFPKSADWKGVGMGLAMAPVVAAPAMMLMKSLAKQNAKANGLANLKALHPEYFQQDHARAEAIFSAVFDVAPSVATNTILMGDLLRQMMSMPMLDLGTIAKLVSMARTGGESAPHPIESMLRSGKEVGELLLKQDGGGGQKTSELKPKFKFAGKPTVIDWNGALKKAGLTDAFTGSGTPLEQANNATMMNEQQQGQPFMPLDAIVKELLQKEQELSQREEVLVQKEQQLQQAMAEMQNVGDNYQSNTGVDPNTGNVMDEGGAGEDQGAGLEGGNEAAPGDAGGEDGAPPMPANEGAEPAESSAVEAAMPGEMPGQAPDESADPALGDDGSDGDAGLAADAAGAPAEGSESAPAEGEAQPPVDPEEAAAEEAAGEEAAAGEADASVVPGSDGGDEPSGEGEGTAPSAEMNAPLSDAEVAEGEEDEAKEDGADGEKGETGEGGTPAAAEADSASNDEPAAEGEGYEALNEGHEPAAGEADPMAQSADQGDTEIGVPMPAAEGEGGEEGETEEGDEEAAGGADAAPGSPADSGENEGGAETHNMPAIEEGESAGPNTGESVEGTPEDAVHDEANKVEEGTPEDAVADKELAAVLNAGGHVAGGGGEAAPRAPGAELPAAEPAAPPMMPSQPAPGAAPLPDPGMGTAHEFVLPLRVSIKIGERAAAYDKYAAAMRDLFTVSSGS